MKNNFNQKKIDRHIKYIDNKIKEYEKQLEEADSEEEKEDIDDKKSYQEQKKRNYQKLENELQSSGESQISLTDPDAKSLVLHRNIVNVGYNVQAASDEKHKLLVNADTMKGKENVLSEVNILFMIYNLRRIISILGPNELKERLKSLISSISLKIRPILVQISNFKHQLAIWNICFVKLLFSQNAHRYAYIE